jgi:high-affinity nickel permease
VELIGLLALSILLGLRHGIDLDHVAALADITGGSSGSKKERMKLSLWYAGGHEAVVFVLGCSILLFAWSVPIWADQWMGKAVGITLIFMAILILIGRRNGNGAYWSRGIAIFQKLRRRNGEPFTFTRRNVFTVGVIHGIGAETPTQLLLFTTVAGVAATNHGMLAVASFSIGLLLSHAIIAIISIWFHDLAKKVRPLVPVTMYAACLFSFVLGVSYLLE